LSCSEISGEVNTHFAYAKFQQNPNHRHNNDGDDDDDDDDNNNNNNFLLINVAIPSDRTAIQTKA